MLSSLFTTIKTTLGLSSNFVISYFLPLLLFVAGSAGVLCGIKPAGWLGQSIPDDKTWVGAIAVAVLVALAYVLSATGTLLRELLEGRHILSRPWLGRGVARRQRTKLDDLSEQYNQQLRRLKDFTVKSWRADLSDALARGPKRQTCAYSRDKKDPGYQAFWRAWNKRLDGDFIDPSDAKLAVAYFSGVLSVNPIDDTEAGKNLKEDYARLRTLLFYAQDRAAYERNDLFSRRQFSFPGVFSERQPGEPSAPSNIVAPTRMGNIGRTIRSYPMNRYSFSMDVMWSRLQAIIQKKDIFPSIQDAKAQVDFLVSLCWLTTLFWAGWAVAIPLTFDPARTRFAAFLFVVMLFAGPVLTRLWYELACQSYTAFADLMRTAVDLYRLELFDSLNLRRPVGIEEENASWQNVANWMGFDENSPGFIYTQSDKT